MKKFKNIISLGFNCHVAKDLERLGYRNASYPFDWLISNFCDVIESIDTDFVQWLKFSDIEQDSEHENVYHDKGTGLDFYHDFFPDKTIEEQYDKVKSKYSRRIERFQKDCAQATLFIRFVRNEEDLKYIQNNQERILSVLKKENEDNDCIYLLLNENLQAYADDKKFFMVTELVHPIKSSKSVQAFIKKNLDMKKTLVLKNKKRYTKKRIASLKKRFM